MLKIIVCFKIEFDGLMERICALKCWINDKKNICIEMDVGLMKILYSETRNQTDENKPCINRSHTDDSY